MSVIIEGILEKKQLLAWQTRKFCLCEDGSFLRYKGSLLRSTAMLTPGTAVVSIGTDQFSVTGLTEEGRGAREYLLRTPSTTLRDDWVSKLEVTVLFMKTKASNTKKSPPTATAAADVSESVHVNAQQVTGTAAAAADEVADRGPPLTLVAAKPTEPELFFSFEMGIRASQLLEYCNSPELPLLTSDVIRHATSSDALGGSMVQQLQRSGGFVGRPTVMVCHAHEAVWKETIDAVCKFCGSLKDGLSTVVWIDVLCLDLLHNMDALYDAGQLRSAVARMDHVLMVSTPWHDPLVLAWPPALWMMHCSLAGPSKKLSIVLTESESHNFANKVSDHVPFIRYLAQFSCQNHLQTPSSSGLREAMAREGWDKVDEGIVEAMDRWFESSLGDAIAAAAAERNDKRKVCIEQVLARLLLDSERYDSSNWKMLDRSKLEGAGAHASAAATAQPVANTTLAAVDSLVEAVKEIANANTTLAAVDSLVEAVKEIANAEVDQANEVVAAAEAVDSEGTKDASKSSDIPAPASPLATPAAPAATRKSAALSLSAFSPKVGKTDMEDDFAFDETVTPDAPVLKYGRNGVPELRQLFLSPDQRFLRWKGKKGGAGSVDLFQLKNILVGQQTETFKMLPSAGLSVVSFSLVLDDRTLDCVAKSVRERRWWCAHIQYLYKSLRPHGSKAIGDSLSKQLQGGKFDMLNDSNKTQLHALFLELMNGREEEKTRNRRKHDAVAKYGTVLDIVDMDKKEEPHLRAARACVSDLQAICTQQAVAFLDACAAISPDLHAIGRFCVTMIEEQVKMFTLIYLEGKELADALVIACLEAMTDARDKVLGCDDDSSLNPALRSHFVMLSSAAPALCWVCHPGLPAELVTDSLNALPVFGQRLEALGPNHVEFFNVLKNLLRAVLIIMNQYHADGVAWAIETVSCKVVTGRFRSTTDENKIFQTDVDFVGIHASFLAGPVERLVRASSAFSQYLQKQVLLCKLAFIEQKNIVAMSRQFMPPRNRTQWEKVLHNMNLLQASIEDMADEADARSENQDSILALRLITGAMGCVSWLIIDLNPYLFLTDVLSGLSVYGDKLVAMEDGSGRFSEFVAATLDLVAELASLVKKNHSHGLVWNPRGEDFVVEELSGVAEEDGQAHP